MAGRSGLTSHDPVASCCRIQSNYMALQRINQELEDKLYRMVRFQHFFSLLRLALLSGRSPQDNNEVGSRAAEPVRSVQRTAMGFWYPLILE